MKNGSVCVLSVSNTHKIDKPQRPERAELPDVNINTDAQSIKGAVSGTSLFLFTSGNDKLNYLK